MHASFSFHHSNLQLTYTTQAWNFKLKKILCHASKHMKCTFKCINKVYELAPPTCVLNPTCVLKILIDPLTRNFNWSLTFTYLSLYVKVLPLCHLTLSLCNFSPFVINDHKGSILDRLRLSMSINGVRIIFPKLVQSRSLA